MRKEYSQYIKKSFQAKLKNRFQDFLLVSKQMLDIDDFTFLKKMKNSWCAISLQKHKYEDAFRINLDWSIFSYEKYMYTSDNNPLISSIVTINELKLHKYELFRAGLVDCFMYGDAWWFIDKSGKAIETIEKFGYISQDASRAYFDTVLDKPPHHAAVMSKEEMSNYIDPLVDNAVDLIGKYAIPIFDYLDEQAAGKQ